MLKDANDSSVLNSILPNIERGQGGMNAKISILHKFVAQMMHFTLLHLECKKCRFLRFYTFCYTNDAFYTLKSIFNQCYILHLEIAFFIKLTKLHLELATNLRAKMSILHLEIEIY